jgi:vacuolar-type H+-ATPase subunit F/Vma7
MGYDSGLSLNEGLHMEMVMVGDKYLATAFRLAGVETLETNNDDSAAKKVEEIVSRGDYKIVIITERVALKVKALRESLLKTRKPYPMFLIVPDFEGPLNERTEELYRLVNQATGVKLKLK